nr:hypothetical protein [Tanacetum cinerariifolium]
MIHQSCTSISYTHVCETSTTTTTQNPVVDNLEEKPVRILPGPAGIVQLAKLRKQSDIHEVRDESVLLTQEYIKKVVEEVDIKNFLKNRKLKKVVSIIKSCTLNDFGDLTVTMKDLSGIISSVIHHKFINEEGFGKDITVGSALILDNVLVFSPKPLMHYLNITIRNMVKVFHKDSVPGNESDVGGSGMLMEEKEEILKLIKEEEMANLELQLCGNVIDQKDIYKFDEEALNLALEEEVSQARADQEWLEKLWVNRFHPISHPQVLLEDLCGTIIASSLDTLAIPRNIIGQINVDGDPTVQKDRWDSVSDQGIRLKLKNAPHCLEPSLNCYK